MFQFRLRMICENPLSGSALQLNIGAFYSRQCASQNGNMCKIQLQKQLKTIFSRVSTIPIKIQFDDNRFRSISIRICSVTEMTGRLESTTSQESSYCLLRRRNSSPNGISKSNSENYTGTNYVGYNT